MSNPIFSRSIAELTPIPLLHREGRPGATSRCSFTWSTMVLGAVSFLVPMFWLAWVRLAGQDPEPMRGRDLTDCSGERPGRKSRRQGRLAPGQEAKEEGRAAVRLAEPDGTAGGSARSGSCSMRHSAVLSLQATRNSHQFAAVVGTVTAWNFAEWAAASAAARGPRVGLIAAPSGLRPRLVALIVLAAVLLSAGWQRPVLPAGRRGPHDRLGRGAPLVPPRGREVRRRAEGMPDRFLSFHNALASLFEYYHSPERPGGPGRTVFTDPRLEVAGPDSSTGTRS